MSRINRAPIRGSFLVEIFAIIDGQRHRIETEAVLSRWNVSGCANCQTHLEVKAHAPLHGFDDATLARTTFEVELRTRDGVRRAPPAATLTALGARPVKPLYKLELR